jgi:uncharacterized membrane protein YecN with MAPEG domain
MICHVCGAQIPNGEMFCPQCGAGQQSSGPRPENRATVYTETASQKSWIRLGVKEPLEAFYSARKALAILSGIMIGALVVLLVYLIATSHHAYEIFDGFPAVYLVLEIIQIGITFFVVIWQAVQLIELKSYEERFGKVVLFMAFGVMISLASAILLKNKSGLVWVLDILKTAFVIGAYYHLCGAFSALTRPRDSGMADKWSVIFVFYSIVQVLSFFSMFVLRLYDDRSRDDWLLLFFFCFADAVAVFAMYIYELILIKKSIELFERGNESTTDTARP